MNIFLKRYQELGQEVKPIQLQTAIRTNLIKISNNELKSRLEERGVKVKKIPFTKNGFYTKSRFSIGSTLEYLQGFYYIQEAASQLPVEILEPKGITVDCCAAPGGKTTQLAMSSDVTLAFESNFKRLQSLKNNLERLGVSNTIVYNQDARKINGNFKKILIDAPCSGNLILDTEWLMKQTLINVQQRSDLQKDILGNMINQLDDKGELVYSTCSLEPEENEMVINWALKIFKVKLMDIDCIGSPGLTNFQGKDFDKSMTKCRRLWPNRTNTQGFFIAKLKK
jgi:NOL1/NOP2/sun family putative RNA methylase